MTAVWASAPSGSAWSPARPASYPAGFALTAAVLLAALVPAWRARTPA